MGKSKEQLAVEDKAYAEYLQRLFSRFGGKGYKQGSFLSLMFMLYRVHKQAKKYDISSQLTLVVGKDL